MVKMLKLDECTRKQTIWKYLTSILNDKNMLILPYKKTYRKLK